MGKVSHNHYHKHLTEHDRWCPMLYISYVRFRFLVSGIIHQATKADHVNTSTNVSRQYKTDFINLSNLIQTSLLMAGSEGRDKKT